MFSDVESFSDAPTAKKTNKPLMEKKRRARINRCLAELKDMLIKDNYVSASHAKWEKADILEMTVDYVKKMRSSKGLHDLKRPAPKLEELDDTATVSPVSVCSPPSTSSAEFSVDIAGPEAKRPRRSDQELAPPTLPHAPIAQYSPGIPQQYLHLLLHQSNFKVGGLPPAFLPLTGFTTGTPTVPLIPWR